MNYLDIKNKHERDPLLHFDELTHSYTYKSNKLVSSTTLIHSFFHPFDSDQIINDMMKSQSWPNNKYYPMTKNEIKTLWSKNSEEAMRLGTKLHLDIEKYLNYQTISNETKEFQFFLNFMKESKLDPYRTEWKIFDEDSKIAGTIDCCCRNRYGEIVLYDWKRSKEIKRSNFKKKYAKVEYLNHLEDVNFVHYSLQLNLYKYILEKKYHEKVKEMYLVVFHPQFDDYLLVCVPDMQTEIKNIIANI